jgi:hypothetical protein
VHLGDVLGRRVLGQAQIQLDHVGAQEGHQRQRAAVHAYIVQGDADALRAQALDGRQQVGGP